MILDGFNFGVSLTSASPSCAGTSWANEIVEKRQQLRLKTATNKDLKLLDTIPSLKFAAKIRAER